MTMWNEIISFKGLTIRKLMASFQYFDHSVISTLIQRVFKETIQACYDGDDYIWVWDLMALMHLSLINGPYVPHIKIMGAL